MWHNDYSPLVLFHQLIKLFIYLFIYLWYRYLMSSAYQIIQRRVVEQSVNNEYEGMWKDAVLPCLGIVYRHVPRGTEETM